MPSTKKPANRRADQPTIQLSDDTFSRRQYHTICALRAKLRALREELFRANAVSDTLERELRGLRQFNGRLMKRFSGRILEKIRAGVRPQEVPAKYLRPAKPGHTLPAHVET